MSKCGLVFLIVIAIYGASYPVNGIQKDWTFWFEQIHWNSTNPDIFKTPLRPARIGPGKYGVSGSFVIGLDIGDEVLIEAKLLCSRPGSNQYTPTIFSIPQCTLSKFMNTLFKNNFMEDMKNCSNAPQFEGKWKPPLQKGEYVLNSCVINTDNFPAHMNPGLYKIIILIQGPSVVVVIEGIARIESTLM